MRRLFWAAMGVALISMVFAGCKKEDHTYSVQITSTEGGTVEGQNGKYEEGETIVFKAIPADGYYFSYWSDGKDDNPRTVIVSSKNISITAIFMGVSPKECGTIETRGNGYFRTKQGDEGYPAFDITAFAADGYCFSQWSDGNTDNPRNIGRYDDKANTSLTAEFVLPTITTVDLGLTSGNLWATCNIGTINPWNIGSYYAWGETQIKNNYSWENYKYCNGTRESLTKYNYDARYGTVDNKKTLEPADDVATAIFGAEYSTPTYDDWQELINECYWVWTWNYNNHEVGGCIVYRAKTEADKGVKINEDGTPSALYSLSDAHIFLPEARQRIDMSGAYLDFGGSYLSASLNTNTNEPYYACSPRINSYGECVESTWVSSRCNGKSVRPIRRP